MYQRGDMLTDDGKRVHERIPKSNKPKILHQKPRSISEKGRDDNRGFGFERSIRWFHSSNKRVHNKRRSKAETTITRTFHPLTHSHPHSIRPTGMMPMPMPMPPNSNPSSNLTIPMDMSVLDVLLSATWGGGLGYITWAPRGVRGSSPAPICR